MKPASVTDNPSAPNESIASFDKNCRVNETDGWSIRRSHRLARTWERLDWTDSTCSVSSHFEAVTVEIASLLPFPGTYLSSISPRCLDSEAKVEACGSSETPENRERLWYEIAIGIISADRHL